MFFRTILLSAVLCFAVIGLFAQGGAPDPRMLKLNAVLGNDYWIAIPPNERAQYPTDELEIYLVSPYDTEVTVYDAGSGRTYKRALKANEVRTLSDARGETSWDWEVREAETEVQKGIRLTADLPFSLTVLNSKVFSSDGYLAIPTHAWGTEYRALSYYDFREVSDWAGGFLVIGREDGTVVTIILGGTGALDATTSELSRIGDTLTVALNAGEVYMVKGNGKTRGLFDLSGSHITSSKAVGVIGFHERTTMPNLLVNGNGRNHLCEMLPPVTAWSTKYVTTEFKRENTNGAGKGDVFRVLASEPNTRWTVKYYDKTTKALIGQGGGLLTNAGDVADLQQASAPTRLTHGYSVWESDKPVLVAQYSCSSSWDGDVILDPFMTVLQPTDRFVESGITTSPATAKFTKHRLNLIVHCDVNDSNYVANLESITVDGVPLYRHPKAENPGLKASHMGDGLHWVTLDFGTDSKQHVILGNEHARFSGHQYAFGSVDACGWTMPAQNTGTLGTDSMPPLVEAPERRDTRTAIVRVIDPGSARRVDSATSPIRSGIAMIHLGDGALSNCTMTRLDSVQPGTSLVVGATLTFTMVDCSRPATAVVTVADWMGNVNVDTVTIDAIALPERRAPVLTTIASTGTLWRQAVTDSVGSSALPPCEPVSDGPDRGIRSIVLREGASTNMRLILERALSTDSLQPTRTARYMVTVVDVTKDAACTIDVTDWAGNTSSADFTYTAPTVSVSETATDLPIEITRRGRVLTVGSRVGPLTSIMIHDLRGRMVADVRPGAPEWSTSLPEGLYLLTAVTGEHVLRVPILTY
jgi:hypothetical protein